MNKKAIAWLYQQLPELVTKGIIPPESADKLKEHYGSIAENTGNRTFVLVFGIIGALLVGLGIILILAHNWAQLTKLHRLMISVGLLVTAQIIAGSVLWFKQDSRAWREAAATLLMLMVGAALALVGQTYHLMEDMDAFMLNWMLLSLPLLYLMNSVVAAILYFIGVTAWSGGQYGLSKQFIWVLFGLALPYYRGMLTSCRQANATVILSWVVTICFYFIFGAAFSNYLDRLGLLIYSALFAMTYLIGVVWSKQEEHSWRLPFKTAGMTGSIGLIFVLTFNDVWRHMAAGLRSESLPAYGLAAVLLIMVIGGTFLLRNSSEQDFRRFSLIPCVIGVAYIIQFYDASGTGATIILNGYMLWLSISIMTTGVRSQSIGVVNLGMLLIVALIVARFFDIDVSFVVRGIVFVLVGLGFLVANIVLLRRKAGWQHEK